jgi:uncharacterized protein (TIGR02391 family)
MNLETRLPTGLWEAVRVNYERRNFTGAIQDGFYFLSDVIRTKSGEEGDGGSLVGQAFGGADPKIKLNRLQSESEKNVQRGTEQLLRGLYQAIRNPRSHDKSVDTEEDTQAILLFLGYLISQIDQAKSPFSREEFLSRVFDVDFVPQDRYAELLVSEIPGRLLFEVFLDVFRAKTTGKPENLKYFFKALIARMSESDKDALHDVISAELKLAEDDATIRLTVGSLGAQVWGRLEEAARLRIENKLIRAAKEGRYDRVRNMCRAGGLGTWATTLFLHFTLRDEFLRMVAEKLRNGSRDEEAYVIKYLFSSLGALAEEMPLSLDLAIRKKLREGSVEIYNALDFGSPWKLESLSADLRKAYAEFKAAEEVPEDLDDDIPF